MILLLAFCLSGLYQPVFATDFVVQGTAPYFGDSYGGYGYLAKSEAAALYASTLDCSKPANNSECHPQGTELKLTNLQESLSGEFIREKILEYYFLQAAALYPQTRPIPLELPKDCSSLDATLKKVRKLPPYSILKNRQAKKNGQANLTELEARYVAMTSQLEPLVAVRTAVFADQLARNLAAKNCSNVSDEPYCVDGRNINKRVKESYPWVFASPERNAEVIDSVYLLLGREKDGPLADKRTIGKATYDRYVRSGNFKGLINKLDDVYRKTSYADHSALDIAAKHMLESYRNNLQGKVDGLCSTSSSSIGEMVTEHPNVVRQLLLDSDVVTKKMLSSQICNSSAFDTLSFETQCKGVCGGPLPGEPIKVRQDVFSSGTRTLLNYEIARADDKETTPYVIRLNINLKADGISEETLRQTAANYEAEVNRWYNCQSGWTSGNEHFMPDHKTHKFIDLKCPPPGVKKPMPPVSFDIHFNVASSNSTTSPSITVHKCYRSEIKSGNCFEVRTFVVNECKESCATNSKADQCKSECEKNTLPVGTDLLNRVDGANLVESTSERAVLHEVGHLLNLPDEYPSNSFPFLAIGETDSTMRTPFDDKASLKERHYIKILSPANRCKKSRCQ